MYVIIFPFNTLLPLPWPFHVIIHMYNKLLFVLSKHAEFPSALCLYPDTTYTHTQRNPLYLPKANSNVISSGKPCSTTLAKPITLHCSLTRGTPASPVTTHLFFSSPQKNVFLNHLLQSLSDILQVLKNAPE